MNLTLNCYPERLDHADQILGFAKDKFLEAFAQKSPELRTQQTTSSLLQLLLAPISAYRNNPLVLLSFPSSSTQSTTTPTDTITEEDATGSWGSHYTSVEGSPSPVAGRTRSTSQSLCGNYTDLLFLQPYTTRRQVAHAVAAACLKAGGGGPGGFVIGSVDGVDAVFGE
ncbi:Vacuolar protein sorting-associated protein 35, partial [Dinochytrium kinnereticum]